MGKNDPEFDNEQDEMAHHSEDLDRTMDGEAIYHDANPGVDEIAGGFGSASLKECLSRITQPAISSATLHSGVGVEDLRFFLSDQPVTFFSCFCSPHVHLRGGVGKWKGWDVWWVERSFEYRYLTLEDILN